MTAYRRIVGAILALIAIGMGWGAGGVAAVPLPLTLGKSVVWGQQEKFGPRVLKKFSLVLKNYNVGR